jgi:hypothetical protein
MEIPFAKQFLQTLSQNHIHKAMKQKKLWKWELNPSMLYKYSHHVTKEHLQNIEDGNEAHEHTLTRFTKTYKCFILHEPRWFSHQTFQMLKKEQ